MTNLEAIRANISDAHGVVLSENHFVKALVDEGLDPGLTYSPDLEKKIDFATIKVYNSILGGAGLSEGSLNYNYQLSGIVAAKKSLLEKWGVEEKKSTIKRAAPW